MLAHGNSSQAAPAFTSHPPDLQTIIPTNSFSIVQTPEGREFRYTHLVYNAGPGPLQIQPEYNAASGTYLGTQQIFTHDAAVNWALAATARVADSFYFHAEHGHFHFPLASFGLYAVAPDGGPGAPVAPSPKNGFCIADSYIYNNAIPHGGTSVGTFGTCTDPTTLRGISVGGADEYDYRDPGQAIPIDGLPGGNLPDGTYWFRAISDPNNDFLEANEANNEMDVKVTLANGVVTAGEVRYPDTTPPPIAIDAPLGGAHLSGVVNFSATSPVTGAGAVEFLVDGVVVGTSANSTSPFTLAWNSTTVVDGLHWIAARGRDPLGRIGTSAVAAVIVDNASGSGGPLAIDAIASANGSGTLVLSGFTTTVAGARLVALVGSDGPGSGGQESTVSGAGLAWSLVRRANARLGTSEVWTAVAPNAVSNAQVTSVQRFTGYPQSMTVVAFSGSDGIGASSGSGAASGAPTTSLITSVDGSFVFGVGNDWDGAVARTLGPNQIKRHEWVNTTVGDTFWMQSQQSTTPAAGTTVVTNAVAPTNHQWNLAAVEIVPAASPPDDQAPQVTVTGPVANATVSGITALGATAADNVGVTSLWFLVDGQPVGPALSNPPFAGTWDTRTASPGTHLVSAMAADAAGNVGTSAPVPVTVDNSGPLPALITIDAVVNARASGTLVAPLLATPSAGDLIVAFVSHGGPNVPSAQSSTVTGGGLAWTLVKRSNTQAGVSEIWEAKASGKLTGAVVVATPLVNGYSGMLTVVAYANASGTGVAGASGAPSGAPDIYLPGVAAGSWCFAAGNDPDQAVARAPVAGQMLHQQWLDTQAGETFWVQSPTAPAVMQSLVTIHDDAPTTDGWNYVATEIAAVLVPQTACNNGLDDDADGLIDLLDPACSRGYPAVPDSTATTESTECQDGLANDDDGRIDFDGGQSIHGACSGGVCPSGVSDVDSNGVADPDPHCVNRPWRRSEVVSCGLGAELLGLVPLLGALQRARSRRRSNA
jgi:hypothetical protein